MLEEIHEGGFSEGEAAVRALAFTADTISSAGLIMAVAFLSLLLSATPTLNEIAFLLTIGVLLDCFVTTKVIIPASIGLLGQYVFWPLSLFRPSLYLAPSLTHSLPTTTTYLPPRTPPTHTPPINPSIPTSLSDRWAFYPNGHREEPPILQTLLDKAAAGGWNDDDDDDDNKNDDDDDDDNNDDDGEDYGAGNGLAHDEFHDLDGGVADKAVLKGESSTIWL